jgi:hypothetical protein
MKIFYTFLCILFSSVLSIAQIYNVTSTISGANEVPPNASAGTGTLTGTYDANTNMIMLNATYSNLSAGLSAAHLHQAPAGSNGGVIVNLSPSTGATSGTILGTFPVPNANESALIAGDFYINLHTSAFPGGEIRGQLTLSVIQTYTVSSDINEANEVPPSGSAGVGTVTGTYDATTQMITISAPYNNLSAGLTAAHLHVAPAGSNGGVIVNLSPSTGATSGTISGTFALPSANESDLFAGNVYINLHTSAFPGGEIRGQLGTVVTVSAESEVEVESGDLSIQNNAHGLILKSPNGTCFRLQVDNNGMVTSTVVTCQ